MNTEQVLYLCDRRACSKCSYPQCEHTTDISHAKNFARICPGAYIEEAPTFRLILKRIFNRR